MLSSPIDEIKERLNIAEVIGSYIKLQKAGANLRAVCPFHSEKKPSFFVSPARQIWHCFGCGIGGNIFDFVMKIEGVEFGDALRVLAQRAGVELRRQPPEMVTERKRLYEVCELAAKFFEKQLEASSMGKEAKKYLLSRGISEESLKNWRIGYAPDVWQGLSDFLSSRNYREEEIEKAGLALSSQKGSFYDRFRGRIIFPIFDLHSQVVGFTGRVFKDRDKTEVAKYVNSPQTLLYDKSRLLYGLDKAKVDIRKKDTCILVEGNMDVIMTHQAGFNNVVATSGTALTPFQLKILKRYTDNLLISFDMDIAGDTATKRGINLAQGQGFNIKIVTMKEGKDPADLIQKNPKDWQGSLEKAKSIMDFYFETTFAKFDKKMPEGKREIAKVLLPVIKRIPNRIVQSHWKKELADELETKEEDIEEELKKIKLDEFSEVYGMEPEEIKSLPPKTRRELLEERVIILLLRFPQREELIGEEILNQFSDQRREILVKVKENPKFNSKKLSPETLSLFNYLALRSEIEEIEEKEVLPEIKYCLREIKSLGIKNKLDIISKDIRKAEKEKNLEKIEKLTKEFHHSSKSLRELEIT